MQKYPSTHWQALRFINGSTAAAVDEFYKKFQHHHGINYDATILPTYAADSMENFGHPDDALIEYVRDSLQSIMLTLTTDFWAHTAKLDSEKNSTQNSRSSTKRRPSIKPTKTSSKLWKSKKRKS